MYPGAQEIVVTQSRVNMDLLKSNCGFWTRGLVIFILLFEIGQVKCNGELVVSYALVSTLSARLNISPKLMSFVL